MSTSKRHREIGTDYIETLLNSSTHDQIRSAAIRLTRTGELGSIRTREDAISSLFETRASEHQIIETLLDLESGAPTKHCLLLRYRGDYTKLTKGNELCFSNSELFITFKVAYENPKSRLGSHVYTIEHEVPVREWKTEDETRKSLQEYSLRHPVFLHFLPEEGVVAFFYPGYSQGSGIKKENRLGYRQLLDTLISILGQECRLAFSSIPIERCIKDLTDAESSRIKIIKTNFESGNGRKMSLAAAGQNKESVDEYLTRFIQPYVRNEFHDQLNKAVREALKNTTPNSLATLWVKEELITRLVFWELGAEFLFLWYGKTQSFHPIKNIFDLLISVCEKLTNPNTEEIWKELLSKSRNEVITLASISSRYSINIDEIKSTIVEAINSGVLVPLYRLKTNEDLIDYENPWIKEPSYLKREFTTVDDNVIDGRTPSNIEVAFTHAEGDAE